MTPKIGKRLESYCDHIIAEYIKAGGKKSDVDRQRTYYTLLGIYEREGMSGVEEFIKSWRPHVTKPRSVGYGG